MGPRGLPLSPLYPDMSVGKESVITICFLGASAIWGLTGTEFLFDFLAHLPSGQSLTLSNSGENRRDRA